MIIINNSPTCISDAPFTEGDIASVLMDASLRVGIDKVRVKFPFSRRMGGPDMWSYVREDHSNRDTYGHSHEPLGFGEVTIFFKEAYTCFGSVEFNPSKIIYDGKRLATWEETQTIFVDVLRLTFPYFEGNDDPKDFKITRLDLAVDFEGVLDPDRVLQDFARFEPIRGRKPVVFQSPLTGAYESVYYKAKSGLEVMAYNKSVQRKDGGKTVRFEVRLPSKELKAFGLDSLAPTHEDRPRAFRARLWPLLARWSGSPSQVRDQILSEPAAAKMLVSAAGLEYLDGFGFHPPLTRNFEKRLRQFKRKFRIGTVKDLFA
jgi:hypothetical protein